MNKALFKTKQNMGMRIGIVSAIVILTEGITLFSSLPSYALTVEEVPNPRKTYDGWVTDSADILSDRTESQLNQMISELESNNGAEIAVVTVPETSPSSSPKEFTTELFNYWGIGKADRDNGVLFLISVGDRRTEIETGYGMESILPDAKVGNIIDTQILPQFKQEDYDAGTLAGTRELITTVKTSANQQPTTTEVDPKEPELDIGDRNFQHLFSFIFSLSSKLLFVFLQLLFLASPWFFMWLLFLSGSSINSLYCKRKLFVEPNEAGRRIKEKKNYNRPICCAECKQKMQKVEDTEIQNRLNKPEKIAQEIGSIKLESWKCSSCSQQPVIFVYDSDLSIYIQECHSCEELTLTHSEVTLEYPTSSATGKRWIKDQCHCCNYYEEKVESIPRLSSSSSSSSSSWSSSSSSSNSSSSSFGGGSSGGGGGGGSW
jgi:uncharacterized protein